MSQAEHPDSQESPKINSEVLDQIVERSKVKVKPDISSKKERVDLEGDEKRVEEFKQAFHNIFIWAVRFLFFLGIIVIVFRIYHLLAPECWQWLTGEQVNNLDKILFSGTIGGFVGKYFKSMFSNTTDYTNHGGL